VVIKQTKEIGEIAQVNINQDFTSQLGFTAKAIFESACKEIVTLLRTDSRSLLEIIW
jgi:hypothetical protein